MPNPIPLATKEEEERRAWVTTHHESVRIIKECFGDRFSNNEIFDRLKISRRTGYRALGNDERIGKAPGRKAKLSGATIREMIAYIEAGKVNDVGNVWKHLALKFAPDCNPKTVQDAVKREGFQNHHGMGTAKMENMLNEHLNEHESAPNEEEAARQIQEDQVEAQHIQQMQQARQAQQAEQVQHDDRQRQHEERQRQHQQQRMRQQHHQQHLDHQSVFDPALQTQSPQDLLRTAIATFDQHIIRYVLTAVIQRNHEAMMMAHQLLFQPSLPGQSSMPPSIPQTALAGHLTAPPPVQDQVPPTPVRTSEGGSGKRRIATCRRCGSEFDRAENTMASRECLYHKGSPQKIDPLAIGTIQQVPAAFIWSCCGRNGTSRGCCQAMHTTKKKRKYSSKKRTASAAGFDDPVFDEAGDQIDNTQDYRLNDNVDSPEAEGEDELGNDSGMDDTTLLQASPPSPPSAASTVALSSQHMGAYHDAFGHERPTLVNINIRLPEQDSGPGSNDNIDHSLQDPGNHMPMVPSQPDDRYVEEPHHHHHAHGNRHHHLTMADLPLPQPNHDIYASSQMMMNPGAQQEHRFDNKQHQQQINDELDRQHNSNDQHLRGAIAGGEKG